MSIISAMYAGVSGIKSFSTAIQVISNNLANMNTIGYKANRTEFGDMLSRDLMGTTGVGGQLGRGVLVQDISRIHTQGTFNSTNVTTDVAIDGNGWYRVEDVENAQSYFTRDGQFRIDEDGYLVNSRGYHVTGFQYDQLGQPLNTQGALNLTNLITQPHMTGDGGSGGDGVYIAANVDSEVAVPPAWDLTDPANTSNFSTAIRVYDSLGNDHEVTVYFRKQADHTWEWHAVCDSDEIDPGSAAAGDWTECANGELTFTNTGALDTETTNVSDFDFLGAPVQNQNIAFNFGDSITTDGGTGLEGTTQFAAPSVVNFQSQDGYSSGSLVSVGIDEEGVITGLFSNGRTRAVGQIGVAVFPNDHGLTAVGNNLMIQTPSSGQPTLLAPGDGAAGYIVPNALELSNVDMASEFVQMIQTQRAYQANTRTVSVGDQLLNETVNLVR